MSNKTKVFFMIAAGLVLVAVGVFASILLIQRFQQTQPQAVVMEEVIKTDVAVLTRDLRLGDRIGQTDVELASVPVEIAPRNAISNLEDAVGKIIKADLIQGQMVLTHNLADPTNNNRDLSFILNEDHVLLAFPADDLMSRESIIQRGDIIDVFATFTQRVRTIGDTAVTAEQEPETRTFTVDTLQNVNITALIVDIIEQDTGGDAGLFQGDGNNQQAQAQPRTRTRAYLLALNPQDALVLKHLKDTGAIFDLVLRAPTSTAQFDLTPVTEEYIVEFYGLEILP